jgi:hypothetical protein
MTSQYFGGRISGGAVGGFNALEKYHEGQLSAEKALLVRNIAHDLKSALHFSADTERQPIDTLVKLLQQKLPNVRPSQGRTQTLSTVSAHQQAICRALAESINRRYGRHVIDPNGEPGMVCEQVSEIMGSLFAGLHGEFASAAVDIKRVFNNLQILKNSLVESFEKMFDVARESGSNRAEIEAMPVYSIFKTEISELDRQLAILNNILNGVVSPTTRTIADLTSEDKDFRGLVKSLKYELGSGDLSRKMSYVLANTNNVALLAAQIDRALKAIGHDVSEFKRYKTSGKLLEHLHDSFERAHKRPTAEQVNSFVTALQMIRENDFMYDDIATEVGKKSRAVDGHKVVRRAARAARNVRRRKRGGGLSGEGDNSLEKRMEAQRKTRETLFADFERRLENQYRQIGAAADVLAKRFGQQVKMDDNLQKFISCMKDLQRDNIEREKFYLALTGYQQDASSREERQRFLGHLNAVSNSLKPLIASSSGSERAHFESIRSSVEEVIKAIDTFKDTYLGPISQITFKAQGGGSDGDALSSSEELDTSDEEREQALGGGRKKKRAPNVRKPSEDKLEHVEQVVHQITDAAPEPVEEVTETVEETAEHIEKQLGGAIDGEGTFATLGQAIRHLVFFYDVARVKHNLNVSAKDIKSYSKDYETILGDAVGDYIVKIKKNYEKLRQKYDIAAQPLAASTLGLSADDDAKFLDEWIKEATKNGALGPDGSQIGAAGAPLTGEELKQWRQSIKDAALKYLKEQMQVQIDLLKTVEAIDIYLMNFADAIASNPDSIKELSQMLKSVDIVGKWFTDKSGNTVAEFLESTPSNLVSTVEVRVPTGSEWDRNQEKHYYEWVKTLIKPTLAGAAGEQAVRLPANPFLGTLPGRPKDDEDSVYDELMKRAEKAARSVRVLDNIVSTFAKLGGQNAQGKTFMPPGVMFKNMRSYLFHSAIVMGMDDPNVPSVDYFVPDGQGRFEPLMVQSDIGPNARPQPVHGLPPAAYNAEYRHPIRVGVLPRDPGVDPDIGPIAAPVRGLVPSAKSKTLEPLIKAAAPNRPERLAAEQWVRARFAMAFSAIPGETPLDDQGRSTGELGRPLNGFSKSWQRTDQLFIMAIKSMVAKIFTVIGTYGVFNRPLDRYKGLSTTRMILGGDFSTPDIKAEAVELYIRLPLLAEFYRSVFEFENVGTTPPTNWETMDKGVLKKITIVPEFDGVWENFIKTVFVDAKYITEGGYSENHIKTIIREVNDIYSKYRNASSTVQDVVSAFVAEINRRYGIVKKTDVEKYLKDRRRYDINNDAYSTEERLEYNILDERDQNGRGPAPSDRFDHSHPSVDQRKVDNPWDWHYIDLVYNFRNRIDARIKNLMPKDGKAPKVSFDATVRAYKQQVETAKDNAERYRIVLKAMQGTDQLSTVNAHKALMFHEVVVAPLSTLYSVWTILNQFIRRIQALDTEEMEKRLDKAIDAQGGAKDFNYFFRALRGDPREPSYGMERYLHRGFREDTISAVPGQPLTMPTMSHGAGNVTDILVYRGMYGARHDITWHDIPAIARFARGAPGAQPTDEQKRAREGLKRFLIDREQVFRDLVNLVFALGADLGETTQVRVQGHNMVLEFAQLMEYCQTLLNSVKKNIEIFRGVIGDDVIRRIEGGDKKRGSAAPAPGSLYFIDEYLMERTLKNSRQGMYSKTSKTNDFQHGIGMIMANEIISRTFKRFCVPWAVTAHLVDNSFERPTGHQKQEKDLKPVELALFKHEQSLLRDSFERPMAELLYWRPNSNPTTAGGALTLKHPLRQPHVVNNSVDEWPYAVIPSIERSSNEDDDVKAIKQIQDAMKSLQKEIEMAAPGNWRAPPPPPAAPAGFNRGAAIFYHPAPAGGAVAPAASWAEVHENFGLLVDVAVDAAGAPTNPAYAHAGAAAARIIEIGGRYNSLYAQRERIFQSSIRTPIDHRAKWYTDPSNAKEGAWFLNQLSVAAGEADEGTTDRANNPDQFRGGLLMRFNEVLAKYLYTGWDTTKRQMYQGLIGKFAAGTHIGATSKGEALNDIDMPWATWQQNGGHSGLLGVPASQTVIFASLARAMRNVMANTRRTGDPAFRVDTMMELPIHMKETLKAALPGYNKLFQLILKKAELLRHIAQQVNLIRQLPYPLKYGVNRVRDATAPGGLAALPAPGGAWAGAALNVVVYGDVQPGGVPVANVLTPNHLRAPVPAAGAPLMGAQRNRNHVNQGLLEPHDLIHMETGFVIRNITDETALRDVGVDVAAGRTHGYEWAYGQPTAAPSTYAGGKRYSEKWEPVMCWSKAERSGQLYVGYRPYTEMSEDVSKRWHVELIDSIAGATISVSKCALDTYKELADEPKYMETHEGFISDYTQMNKQAPIMLLSQLQVGLRPRFRDQGVAYSAPLSGGEWDVASQSGYARPNFLLPFYKSGESPFKLQYGSRLILGRPDIKPGLEYMPGMTGLLERYNGVSSSDTRIEKTEFELNTIAHTQLLRFVTDLRFGRAALDSAYSGRVWTQIYPRGPMALPANELDQVAAGSALFDTPLDIAAEAGNTAGRWPITAEYKFPDKSRPYTMRTTLEEALAITESSDQDNTLKTIVQSLKGSEPHIDSRSEALIYNIIDLNIVPINVHALQREIPLVNIINYSYTCDRMIQDRLMPRDELPGQNDPNQGRLVSENEVVHSTPAMLTKMLLYPYAPVNAEEYYGYIHRIMAGDSSLELGRPKFISDQLWNKVLFQELYTQPGAPARKNPDRRNRPDEGGPDSDSVTRRALRPIWENPDQLISAAEFVLNRLGPGAANPFAVYVAAIAGRQPEDADAEAALVAVINDLNAGVLRGTANLPRSLAKDPILRNAVHALAPVIDNNLGLPAGPNNRAMIYSLAMPYQNFMKQMQDRVGVPDAAAHGPFQVRPALPRGLRSANTIRLVALATLIFAVMDVAMRDGKEPSTFTNTGTLQYPDADDDGQTVIGQVDLHGCPVAAPSGPVQAGQIRSDLAMLGRMRFDTTFIRNIFFLVNLQRVMRMIMRDETQFLESPVVNSSAVMNRQVTEYQANERYDAEVFHP